MTTPRHNDEMADRYADPATAGNPSTAPSRPIDPAAQQQSAQPMTADPSYPPGETELRPSDRPEGLGQGDTTGYADAPAASGQPTAPSQGVQDSGGLGEDGLFGRNDLADLRSRWNDVQAAFVDDPRACVQQADSLVSTAVEQLTSNFARTRSQLEDQWQRGEEASTEDLRVALKRYRDFFDRLLSV